MTAMLDPWRHSTLILGTASANSCDVAIHVEVLEGSF